MSTSCLKLHCLSVCYCPVSVWVRETCSAALSHDVSGVLNPPRKLLHRQRAVKKSPGNKWTREIFNTAELAAD